MPRLALVSLVVLALSLVGPPAPAAQAAMACTTTLTNVAIATDVVVPSGATCVLERVTVRGNVSALPEASLLLDQSTRVQGNITAIGAQFLSVANSLVGGNVIVLNTDSWLITFSTIGGNAILRGASVIWDMEVNKVGGNVSVTSNTGLFFTIRDNTIGGVLTCTNNSPAPTNGTIPNTAVGGKKGQCASL
jgi:hypothetical protein